MRSTDADLFMSSLCMLEVVNAMELRAFRKERTADEISASLKAFQSDINLGVFTLLPLPPSSWDLAVRLSEVHTRKLGRRSLDILHVAAALAIKADVFITFDRNQANLAKAAGLKLAIRQTLLP